jgi:hypothetical protein
VTLNDLVVDRSAIFDDAPVAMKLAVLNAAFCAQKHALLIH